jgi:hypothetical protein
MSTRIFARFTNGGGDDERMRKHRSDPPGFLGLNFTFISRSARHVPRHDMSNTAQAMVTATEVLKTGVWRPDTPRTWRRRRRSWRRASWQRRCRPAPGRAEARERPAAGEARPHPAPRARFNDAKEPRGDGEQHGTRQRQTGTTGKPEAARHGAHTRTLPRASWLLILGRDDTAVDDERNVKLLRIERASRRGGELRTERRPMPSSLLRVSTAV